jgi:hypothetical protein
MSRPRETDKPETNQSDPGSNDQNKPADQNVPEQNAPPGNSNEQKNVQEKKDGKQNIAAIEEHKKNLNISAPIFAAVVQSKGWASGKRVPEAIFKEAVEDFLGAPMDGVRIDILTIEEHQKNLKYDAPVIEAVMKAKGWRINSKLPEAVLKKAAEEYLANKEGGE